MDINPTREACRKQPALWLVLPLCAVILYIGIRTAWLSDDVYITFRVIENWLSGHGLRWNIDERVQVYTHPLWMMLLAAGRLVWGELYYPTAVLSLGCALTAVFLLARQVAVSNTSAVLAVTVLAFSKAFTDYMTSGLENPLTYLLIVLFAWCFFEMAPSHRKVFVLSLISGLAVTNRMDTGLIFAPGLLWALWKGRSLKAVGMAALGLAPFMAWEVFAVVYYGFPFPNTAHAKLGSGVSQAELYEQGFYYYANSWQFDPVTLAAIVAAAAVVIWRRERAMTPIILGVALYCFYTLRIGGDFMSGRFLAAPLLCAAVLLARVPFRRETAGVAALAVCALGFHGPFTPLLSTDRYGEPRRMAKDEHGIADERQYYYQALGLLSSKREGIVPAHAYVRDGLRLKEQGDVVAEFGSVGFRGYFAGPEPHIVDYFGLADPLLARLPAKRDPNWRIGHFRREVPEGYAETAWRGRNVIQDAGLREYYEHLSRITRGPLFSAERWRAIVAMNLGRYDYLLEMPAPKRVEVRRAE